MATLSSNPLDHKSHNGSTKQEQTTLMENDPKNTDEPKKTTENAPAQASVKKVKPAAAAEVFDLDAVLGIQEIEQIRHASDLYQLQQKLGRGSFGKVYQALYKPTKEVIAVKVLRNTRNLKKEEEIKQEVTLMQQLDHPNIVKLKHVFKTRDNFYLGMELVRDGSLEDLLQERRNSGQRFTDKEVSTLIRSILSALAHMHEQDTMHRDLKPSNVLLMNKNDLSSVRIIDFGLSEKYVLLDDHSNWQGTLMYMAPEALMFNGQSKISKSVDIWSIGIIMYQLLSGGQHPLSTTQRESLQSYQKKLKDVKDSILPEECPFLSPIAKKFLERLVQVDRTLRYTAHDALQHPWVTRQKQNRIPLNLVDQLSEVSFEKKLRLKLNLMHFVSIQSIWQQSLAAASSPNNVGSTAESDQTNADGAAAQSAQQWPLLHQSAQGELKKLLSDIGTSEYKKKLTTFSKEIDRWHEEQSKLNTGLFEEDRDFVELDRSPSKFDVPASDQDSIDEYLLGYSVKPAQDKTENAEKQGVEAPSPSDDTTVRNSNDPEAKLKSPKKLSKGLASKKQQSLASSPTTNQKSKLGKNKNRPAGLYIKLRNLSPNNGLVAAATAEDPQAAIAAKATFNSAQPLKEDSSQTISPTRTTAPGIRDGALAHQNLTENKQQQNRSKNVQKSPVGRKQKVGRDRSVSKEEEVADEQLIEDEFQGMNSGSAQPVKNKRQFFFSNGRQLQPRKQVSTLQSQENLKSKESSSKSGGDSSRAKKYALNQKQASKSRSKDKDGQVASRESSTSNLASVRGRFGASKESFSGSQTEVRVGRPHKKRKAVVEALSKLLDENKQLHHLQQMPHITIEGEERDHHQFSESDCSSGGAINKSAKSPSRSLKKTNSSTNLHGKETNCITSGQMIAQGPLSNQIMSDKRKSNSKSFLKEHCIKSMIKYHSLCQQDITGVGGNVPIQPYIQYSDVSFQDDQHHYQTNPESRFGHQKMQNGQIEGFQSGSAEIVDSVVALQQRQNQQNGSFLTTHTAAALLDLELQKQGSLSTAAPQTYQQPHNNKLQRLPTCKVESGKVIEGQTGEDVRDMRVKFSAYKRTKTETQRDYQEPDELSQYHRLQQQNVFESSPLKKNRLLNHPLEINRHIIDHNFITEESVKKLPSFTKFHKPKHHDRSGYHAVSEFYRQAASEIDTQQYLSQNYRSGQPIDKTISAERL